MLCTIGAVSAKRFNDQESAEEDFMYDMNLIMHRLISSIQVYAAPPLATTGGNAGARARVSRVEVQDVIVVHTFESNKRHASFTPQDLSECCCIGLGRSTETLKRTT